MKKSIFIVINLLIVLSVFSQNEVEKTTIKGKPKMQYYEFALGVSFPDFNFKNTVYMYRVGQACTGANLSIEASTVINKWWGYKYDFNFSLYPGRKNDLPSNYTNIETGYWINLNFGMGGFVNLNIKKTILSFAMNGGFTSMSSPSVKYKYLGYSINSYSDFGMGFFIKPNFSVYCKLHDKIELKLFVNYQIIPYMFDYKPLFIGDDNLKSEKYSSFNLGVGVKF